MACSDVMAWPRVDVMRSCSSPISSASVGWYPTAEGIRPSSAVLLGLAVDHLLDDHRLAHARAAEHPDLPTLHVGLQEVDDLDAGLEHLGTRLEVLELRRVPMDRPVGVGVDGVGVEGRAQHV